MDAKNPVLRLGYEFFEHATSQGLCLRRSRLAELGQGDIGPLFFHGFFVKHNIEKPWYFIPPPPPQTFSTRSQATLQSAELRVSPFTVYPSPSTKLMGMGGAGRSGGGRG